MKALFWKEARQILPLAAVLLVVTLFVLVINACLPTRFAFSVEHLVLVLPMFFAVGAGAISVSQEKDNRTLDWVNALPVSNSRTLLAKMSVSIIGLAAMWLLYFLLMLVIDSGTPGANAHRDWLVQSGVILFAGIFAAWYCQQSFTGLLLVIPLATVPWLVVWGLSSLGLVNAYPREIASLTLRSAMVVIPLYAGLAWWAGQRCLRPAKRPKPAGDGGAHHRKDLVMYSPPVSVDRVPAGSFRWSITSIAWASTRANARAYWTIVGLLWLASAIGPFQFSLRESEWYQALPNLLLLAVPALVALLGVFVFAGDGSSAGLRFLADRGISPRKIWWGRHGMNLSVIATSLLIYAVAQASTDKAPHWNPKLLPSLLCMSLVALGTYSISQGVSQMSRILAANVVIAPVLSLMGLAWLSAMFASADCPLWLAVACAMLPLIATRCAMRKHVDGGRGWGFWWPHLVAVLGMLLIPCVPAALQYARFPRVDAGQLAAIENAASQLKLWGPGRHQIVRKLSPLDELSLQVDGSVTGEQAAAMLAQRRDRPQSYFTLPGQRDEPLRGDLYLINAVMGSVTKWSILAEQNPDDQQAVESLSEWVASLTTITRRLRLSEVWVDQEIADQAEITLTAVLREPGMTQLIDDEVAEQAIEHLADRTKRNAARRRAVLATWRREQERRQTGRRSRQLGFSTIAELRHVPAIRSFVYERMPDLVVIKAIELLDAEDSHLPTDSVFRDLHELLFGAELDFEAGPYADSFRCGHISDYPANIHQNSRYPATQWFAPWETDAEGLVESDKEFGP